MNQDDEMTNGSDQSDSTENSPEIGNSKLTPNPYFTPSGSTKLPKKGNESCKWVFKNDPASKTPSPKRNLKKIMDAECDSCSDCVRNCEVFECPFWQYRSKACKVHLAFMGRLRKTATLSDGERKEVRRIYEAEDKAMRRVFDLALRHCPSKLRTFVVAYMGKSRASAVEAYRVWMANYDLTMVEQLKGGSE